MRKVTIGVFILLAACNEKNPEKGVGESRSKPSATTPVSDVSQSERESGSVESGNFELKELPAKQPNVDTPQHIHEVNFDVQEIISSSVDPSLAIWNKYYHILMGEKESVEIIPPDVLWNRLSKELGAERFPSHLYLENENVSLQKSLYGLYLATFISSSNGGSELFDFIQERAGDGITKQIDLNLYKIIVAGMTDADGPLNQMSFQQWEKFSDSPNPVYRMLAVQVGSRLFEEDEVSNESPEIANRHRLEYYSSFLDDESQKIRLEAIIGVKQLGKELSLPLIDDYLKGEYGESDRDAVNKIFGKDEGN